MRTVDNTADGFDSVRPLLLATSTLFSVSPSHIITNSDEMFGQRRGASSLAVLHQVLPPSFLISIIYKHYYVSWSLAGFLC